MSGKWVSKDNNRKTCNEALAVLQAGDDVGWIKVVQSRQILKMYFGAKAFLVD